MTDTHEHSISQKALNMLVQWQLGLNSSSNISAWADEVIMRMDTPPTEIVDLACDASEPYHLFHALGQSGDGERALRNAVNKAADLLEHGTLKLHDVIKTITAYAWQDEFPVLTAHTGLHEEIHSFFVNAGDVYDDAVDGPREFHTTLEDLHRLVIVTLRELGGADRLREDDPSE